MFGVILAGGLHGLPLDLCAVAGVNQIEPGSVRFRLSGLESQHFVDECRRGVAARPEVVLVAADPSHRLGLAQQTLALGQATGGLLPLGHIEQHAYDGGLAAVQGPASEHLGDEGRPVRFHRLK